MSDANDAQRISLLFEYGVINGKDVVEWADSAIVKMDSLPESLLELSLTAPEKTGEIMSHLHELGFNSDFWAALRNAIPQILAFIINHPDRAESIANHFFRAACHAPNKVPKDLGFMLRFDDAFALARDGIYGEPQAVYRDFVDELNKVSLGAGTVDD